MFDNVPVSCSPAPNEFASLRWNVGCETIVERVGKVYAVANIYTHSQTLHVVDVSRR